MASHEKTGGTAQTATPQADGDSTSPSHGGLRVAVVGGSIGGCAVAAELVRIGCDVHVFERSAAVVDDRGAGISTSRPHLARLHDRGLVDIDMPVVDRTSAVRQFTARGDDPVGRVLWEQPIATFGMNWGILFKNLRRRVPDARYHTGVVALIAGDTLGEEVLLELDGGERRAFDLVVAADGYASSTRRLLFPDTDMEYGGYVAWRGLIPETGIDPHRPATEMAMHDGGHCVVYYIPGVDGDVEPGRRRVNWVWYRVVTRDELDDLLVDRNGRRHQTSLPRGATRDDVVVRLHDDARRLLRAEPADVIGATPDPFCQVVYDVHVPTHRIGRALLVGDAACVARPHTGAGAMKATQEAMALGDALERHRDLDTALDAWNEEVHATTTRMFELGRTLGQAMVLDPPDWTSFDADRTEAWWNDASSGSFVYYSDHAST